MLNRCYGMIMVLAVTGALLCQVYVPYPDINIYFVESTILAAWLVADAIDRQAKFPATAAWAIASFVLAPITIPHWYAHRRLKAGECRHGGVDSNFFTAFGITTLLYTGVSAACNFLVFGPDKGFELIINCGFAVAGTGLILGLVSKQEKVTEMGPNLIATKVKELE